MHARISSAEIEYPVLKDANGEPRTSTSSDGTITYLTCPNGIEVFSNKDGPQGVPLLAPFPQPTGKRKEDRVNRETQKRNQNGKQHLGTGDDDEHDDHTAGDKDQDELMEDLTTPAQRVDPEKTVKAYKYLLTNFRSALMP